MTFTIQTRKPAAAGRNRLESGRRAVLNPLLVLVICGVFEQPVFLAPAFAQPAAPSSPSPMTAEAITPADPKPAELTLEAAKARLKRIDEAEGLEEAVKTKAVDFYKKAVEQLEAAARSAAMVQSLAQAVQDAPTTLEQVQAELGKPSVEVKIEIPAEASLADLQQRLSNVEAQLLDAQKKLADRESEMKRRAERRIELPKFLAAAKQQLQEIQKQLALKPPAEEPPEITQAARTLLEARQRAFQQEILALEQELPTYDATARLLTARRDLAARELSQTERLAKFWRELVNERRRAEAEQQAREARRAAAEAHPAVQLLAKENTELADERKDLAAKIDQTTRDKAALGQKTVKVNGEFEELMKRVEAVGFTHAIGVLLRKQRLNLPNIRDHQRRITARQPEISNAHLKLLEYQDQRAALVDFDDEVEQLVKSLNGSLPQIDHEDLNAELRSLLEAKRDYLDSLINDYSSYLDQLVALDTDERQLIAQTTGHSEYIAEHILWIRNTSPIELATFPQAGLAISWIAGNAGQVAGTLYADALQNTLLFGLGVLLFSAIQLWHHKLRARLRAAGQLAAKSTGTSLAPTLESLVWTMFLALLWPIVLWFIGWRLGSYDEDATFARAVGAGLRATAVIFFTLEMFRQVCRPHGLADAHFRWPERGLATIRTTLQWLAFAALPLVFLIELTNWHESEVYQNALGRIAFILAMILLSGSLKHILRPNGGMIEEIVAYDPGGWLHRSRYAWYALGTATPIILAVLAAAGYYYTAQHLGWRLLESLWLITGLVVFNAMLGRWLLLTYRTLAIKHARERRAAQSESSAAGPVLASEETLPQPAAPEVNLSASNVQTRNLLRMLCCAAAFLGVWFIWIDVLPALGVLRHVELWGVTVPVAESIAGAAGVTQVRAITLADLFLGIVVAVVTVVAGANIPGLLEFTVLRRLPLDSGARYAITTISRYVITIVGVVIVVQMLGIDWSRVQWLIAAMGVGLGFGLQEIFGNFVSGLILLFERPIRLGDTVTVGDVSGRVSRIRIRATTIVDWNRKELIVPNKEFVTGRLMNWTLSDSVLRVVINIGIAYGSDTARAQELLLKIAKEHPSVLEDPPPSAFFMGFGESSLDFELRVFVPTLECLMPARHQMNMAIDQAFRNAGIEIAFPQRDLHVRSLPAGLESAHWSGSAKGNGNGAAVASPEKAG